MAVRVWSSLVLAFVVGMCNLRPAGAEESFAAQSARMKREFEQQKKQAGKEFAATQKKLNDASSAGRSAIASSSAPRDVAFDARSAPRPEQCFGAFLVAARKAKSYNEIAAYLPAERREYYDREQKAFNPQQAKARRTRYEQEGQLDAQQIQHLTSPPYEIALKGNQEIARKVHELVGTRVSGNRAYLDVTIHVDEVINGVRHTKSTATVGLVGEGDYWRFESFQEGLFAEPE